MHLAPTNLIPIPVTAGGTGEGTAFTAGSVLYATTAGIFAQDNSNLFWDASNHRLGVGTASPSTTLEVDGIATIYNSGSGTSAVVGNSASAVDVRLKVDAALAHQPILSINSAGTEAWAIFRPGATNNLSIFDSIAGAHCAYFVTSNQNVGFGGVTAFGTSAAKCLGIATGTAPSTSPASMVQVYCTNSGGSNTGCLAIRTEAGNVIKLYQEAGAAEAAVATTSATQTTPWGFTTSAQANALVTLVNEIRRVLVAQGLMKGSA